MTDNETSKFRIRLDDDIPDAPIPEEAEDLQIKKLGHRITFITFLIPFIIGIVFLFAYLDIKKRVGTVHDTGTTEVHNLSKDLESRFSSLAKGNAELKDTLTKQISSIEATLEEVTTAIKYIRTARRIDNKKSEAQIAGMEKVLKPVRENLDNILSDINTLDERFSQKLVQLTEAVDNAKKEISTVSSAKIDKKAFDLAILKEQVRFQEKLNKISARFEENLESVSKKIKELEKRTSVFGKSQNKAAKETASPKSPSPTPLPPDKPTTDAITPEPGKIVEQDIQ